MERGYGGELILHFGERLLGPVRNTKHGEFRYKRGTFSLHMRGSAWVIKSGINQSILSEGRESEFIKVFGEPLRRADVVAEFPVEPGCMVTAMMPFIHNRPDVMGIGLRVEFSDGSTAIVIPTPDDEDPLDDVPEGTTVYEVADWELKTPHFTLQVGPGLKWHLAPHTTA
jgi:hypothetical protein